MKTRYMTILTTLVLLGFTVSTFAAKPGGGGGTTYTAELTAGGFVFTTGELLGLTAEKKGKSLSGNFTLEMREQTAFAWDYIFLTDCPALLGTGGFASFGVLAKDWGISYTTSRGGLDQIHISMNNLITHGGTYDYSQVGFHLHLHGEIAGGVDFLPKSGSVSHQLTKYKLWSGTTGADGFTCNSAGGGMADWAELAGPSTLKITRGN